MCVSLCVCVCVYVPVCVRMCVHACVWRLILSEGNHFSFSFFSVQIPFKLKHYLMPQIGKAHNVIVLDIDLVHPKEPVTH